MLLQGRCDVIEISVTSVAFLLANHPGEVDVHGGSGSVSSGVLSMVVREGIRHPTQLIGRAIAVPEYTALHSAMFEWCHFMNNLPCEEVSEAELRLIHEGTHPAPPHPTAVLIVPVAPRLTKQLFLEGLVDAMYSFPPHSVLNPASNPCETPSSG